MTLIFLAIVVLAFALLVALVLKLEITKPKAPLTVALRNWQTGMSALLGLLGVAVSISLQGYQTERLQTAQLTREIIFLAVAMQREQLEVMRWLKEIDAIRTHLITDRSKPTAIECRVFYDRIKNEKYSDLGIIEENRTTVGKLPTMLGVHFLDLRMLRRRMQSHIDETTDKQCDDEPKFRFELFDEDVGNLKTVFERIGQEMKKLPETATITIAY